MKLVSIHKYKLILLLFAIGFQNVQAQTWTLEKCIETAEKNNKNLQISKNNILAGDQKRKEVVVNLIPKITLNGDYKYFGELPTQLMPLSVFGGPEGKFKEAQFGVPHNLNANLQFSMPLYNSQIYGAMKTTKIAKELHTLKYQKSEEQLFFEISNLYYNAQILSNQLAFVDSNLLNINSLLANMKLLNTHKLIKGTDVSKVQLQKDQLVTKKKFITSKYTQVMNALKFSMGISLAENIQVEKNILYTNSTEYVSQTTLDLRLANTKTRLISSELSTLKNSRLPSLALFGSVGYTGYGFNEEPNEFLEFYPMGFAGIKLSYPLFNGTVTKRKINQKKFELQNSKLQVTLVSEKNSMLVANANLQKTSAIESIETTLKQIKLAQSIYNQTVLQKKQGTASLTEVLLADNSLREAQQTYLSAIVDYLKADLELKKLTGNIKK